MTVDFPNTEAIAPLSATQSGMLFDLVTSPREGMYVEQGLCTITGTLNADRFRAAWQGVVDRHPMLRASFLWNGLSHPVQVVRRSVEVPILIDDAGDTDMEEVSKLHRLDLQDLARPCLMRLHLRRNGPESAQCLWSIHHLIHDAWSLELLLQDFFTLYEGYMLQGAAPSFLEIAVQASSAPKPETTFWRDTLRGSSIPTLAPGEDISPEHPAMQKGARSQARNFEIVLPQHEADVLRTALAVHEITLNSLMLAAWAAVLAAWNRNAHVVFGTVLNGRSRAELMGIVGPCITALPFGVRLRREQSLLDLLRQVQEQQVQMMELEATTVAELKQSLGADAPRNLFTSLIVFQNAFRSVEGKQASGLRVSGLTTAGFPSHPLMLRVTPGERPRLEVVYEISAFPELRDSGADYPPEQLLHLLIDLFRSFVAAPDQPVEEWIEPLPKKPLAKPASNPRPRFANLQAVKPRVFSAALKEHTLESNGTRVSVYEAQSSQDLLPWITANAELLAEHLKRNGAVLLRGFREIEASGVEAALHTIAGESLEYRERSSPRTQVAGRIYTSTEHPPDQTIFFHNENSYAHMWPRKIAFYCKQASLTGGATPLADVRRVLEHLPPVIRSRFEEVGVRYLRNFDPCLGMSWQSAFQSNDRDEVMAACRRGGYTAEWREGDRLRVWRTASAVVRHPDTGEAVWFNHAAFFHLSTLDPTLQESLMRSREEADLPNQTYFGDGSPISSEVADTLRQAYMNAELSFPWRINDMLLLDNMLIAHGRQSFTGPRKILVGMAAPMGHMHSGDEQ